MVASGEAELWGSLSLGERLEFSISFCTICSRFYYVHVSLLFWCCDKRPWSNVTSGRVYLGLCFWMDNNNHSEEAWNQLGKAAGGGKLREHIFNQKSKGERADWKWGEIMHFESPSLATYFLQQSFTSWTLSSRATKWKPSVQVPEPAGVISHSDDNNTVHRLFRKLVSLAMDMRMHGGALDGKLCELVSSLRYAGRASDGNPW